MNRREFIKGLAAFAVLALAPSMAPGLVQTEMQRLQTKFATSLVENEIFYLNGPIVLENIKNLLIRNCHFMFRNVVRGEMLVTMGNSV